MSRAQCENECSQVRINFISWFLLFFSQFGRRFFFCSTVRSFQTFGLINKWKTTDACAYVNQFTKNKHTDRDESTTKKEELAQKKHKMNEKLCHSFIRFCALKLLLLLIFQVSNAIFVPCNVFWTVVHLVVKFRLIVECSLASALKSHFFPLSLGWLRRFFAYIWKF